MTETISKGEKGMITLKQKKHDRVLKLTLLVTAFMMLMAAVANVLWADEIQEEIISEEIVTEAPKAVGKSEATSGPLMGLRIMPLFGVIRPADTNKWLSNKYSAGVSAEVPLSDHVSVEGVFRYSMFDVKSTLYVSDSRQLVSYHNNGFPGFVPSPANFVSSLIGEMRQISLGGNIKYELFPKALLSPFVGTGLSYFDNEYISKDNPIRISFPQSVYSASILGGIKLRLAKALALVGQAEAGTLLNNRSTVVYGPFGGNFHSRRDYRSYDKYITATTGLSFGF